MDPGLVDTCLRRDPRVPPASSSNCTDYTAGGREGGGEEFVAVRLAAAALSTQSTQTQRLNANLLSSVVPQMKKFNTSKKIKICQDHYFILSLSLSPSPLRSMAAS